MLIDIPQETFAGETRVAVTPETVKKLKAQGHTLRVQSGAGIAASVTDEAYVAAGAEVMTSTPQQTTAFLTAEGKRWSGLIQRAGNQLEGNS